MLRKIADSYIEAFEGLPSSVWLMSFVVMINRCGTMVMPFLGLYATKSLGIEETNFGYLLCYFGLGGIVGSYLGGHWAKRFGAFPYMIMALGVSGPMFFLLGFLKTELSLAFFLPLLAVATESARPATSTAVTELCKPALHTKALALLRTAVNLGMAIGPVIGGAVYIYGFYWLVGINGFFNIAAAILIFIYFGNRKSKIQAAKKESVDAEESGEGGSPFADVTFMVAIFFNVIAGIAFFQLLGIYPIFIRDSLGWTEFQIGLALAVNTILIVAVEMVIVDRLKKKRPLVMIGIGNALVFFGLGSTCFAVWMTPLWAALMIVLSIVIWTIGEIISMPLMLAYTSQKATTKTRSQYMGVMGMSFSISLLLSPIIGTQLYDRDPMLPWYVMIAGAIPIMAGYWGLSLLDKTMLHVEDAKKEPEAETEKSQDDDSDAEMALVGEEVGS